MTRVQHWDTRALHDFLVKRVSMPFQWGANDCALFAADGIEAMTGTDIAADFRGRYTTELGAFRAIKTIANGTTVADAVAYCAAKSGMAELEHPLKAQRGDLVVLEDAGRLISGLVHLSGRHIAAVGESGLKRIAITAVKRAWRV